MMKLALVTTLTLLCFTPLANAETNQCRSNNPQWYGCSTDSDCTIINNPCGWPTEAANKASADVANTCNQHVGAALSCPAYNPISSGVFSAKCNAGSCVAVKQ